MHERWRPISGASGYFVSDLGRIRSDLSGGRMLKPSEGRKGYHRVCLYLRGQRFTSTVHRLVLNAFVGDRPTGQQCRHMNGDPADNRLTNLRWGTQAENTEDQRRHWVEREAARVTPDVERRIRRLHMMGARVRDLATAHRLRKSTVRCIIASVDWVQMYDEGQVG